MNRFLGSGSKAGGAGNSADTRKEWSKNSDLVRSQIVQKMLTEEEHLVVEREILERGLRKPILFRFFYLKVL